MAGVLAAVFVREELEEEEGLVISSRGRVWWGGGLYCATERTGFSFAALSKLASLSIRNLRGEREREREREREIGRERLGKIRGTVEPIYGYQSPHGPTVTLVPTASSYKF